MLTESTAASLRLVKMPRFTYSGLCLWCETRGCVSARCVEAHALSVWAVCEDCDGTTTLNEFEDCCALGVQEYMPDALSPEVLAAYRAGTADAVSVAIAPVSVPPVLVSAPLPRCLGCGHRTANPHEACKDRVYGSAWTPCGQCWGTRTDESGFECELCCGVGFIDLGSAPDTLAERAGEPYPW